MMNKHEDYQDALNDIIHNTLNNWEYKNDSFWLMQELVDRATPKKPVGSWPDYLCPNCKKSLYWDDETCDYIYENYCIHCGQQIDWNNDEI